MQRVQNMMPKIIENKEKVEIVICETHGNPKVRRYQMLMAQN